MSQHLYVFVDRDSCPDGARLQRVISKLGYQLKLHDDFMPYEDGGFLPCKLNGEGGRGFSISYGYSDGSEILERFSREFANQETHYILLGWRSHTNDLACALIIALALSSEMGGIVTLDGTTQTDATTLKGKIANALLGNVAEA